MNHPFIINRLVTAIGLGCRSVLSLLLMLMITIAGVSTTQDTGADELLTVRVYVAGESVEAFNNFSNLPFNSDGTLNNRGDQNNTAAEYGWMFPLYERLKKLDSNLAVEWVGSGCWTDQDTWECSTGTYTNESVGHTSAVAGSTVAAWISDNADELTSRTHCYDVAFVSRGGNDLNNDVPRATYTSQLTQLITLVDQGSNCRTHPVIYVTAHLLDIAGWSYGYQQSDIEEWMALQQDYYVDAAQEVVTALNGQNGMIVRFIDMWTPFYANRQTTAFPSETWWTVDGESGVSMPDLPKIHRDEAQHPRRLASIFAGENAADQIDTGELRQLLAGCREVADTTYPSGSVITETSQACLVTSGAVVVNPGADVRFEAATSVTLNPGFRAEEGSSFSAAISP